MEDNETGYMPRNDILASKADPGYEPTSVRGAIERSMQKSHLLLEIIEDLEKRLQPIQSSSLVKPMPSNQKNANDPQEGFSDISLRVDGVRHNIDIAVEKISNILNIINL